MIKTQWLELPVSRTNLYGPKDVRVIEVRLYGLELKGPGYIYIFRLFHKKTVFVATVCFPVHWNT